MEQHPAIEISLSKTKLAKLLIFSILFLVGGGWMIIYKPEVSNPVFNNIFVKTFAAYACVVMGVAGIYFFTRKLFDKRPGVIIDSSGITDHSGALSGGLIPWHNVSEIVERSVQASIASKQKFVTIMLKDPEQYIQNEANPVKRKLMSMNAKGYGSPVHISTNGLTIKHEALLQLLKEKFEAYKSMGYRAGS
jgi:hypothetical protein